MRVPQETSRNAIFRSSRGRRGERKKPKRKKASRAAAIKTEINFPAEKGMGAMMARSHPDQPPPIHWPVVFAQNRFANVWLVPSKPAYPNIQLRKAPFGTKCGTPRKRPK